MHAWVEHTAELQLELEAPTREEVFAEAFLALRELLADAGEDEGEGERERERGSGEGEIVERRVEAGAPDPPALLAEWLQELVFLVESEGAGARGAGRPGARRGPRRRDGARTARCAAAAGEGGDLPRPAPGA
jgi:SHS2 domain-containing protein